MFDFSITIVWILFFAIHIVSNAYLYFFYKKIAVYWFAAIIVAAAAVSMLLWGWQYGIAIFVMIAALAVEKLILTKVLVVNKIFATAVVFWFVFGSFELIKALAMLCMIDYCLELTTIFIHKRVFPRRLKRDND